MEVQVLSSAWNRREGVSRLRENQVRVILLWPLLLVGASLLLWKSRQRGLGRQGWPWFVAWTLAGAVFVFSFLTGSSVGVFLFPVAAIGVLWLAVNSPDGRELACFAVGIAAVLLVLVSV